MANLEARESQANLILCSTPTNWPIKLLLRYNLTLLLENINFGKMANYGELKMAIMERREARRTIISCSTPTNSPIALLLKYYLTLLLEKKRF